MSDTVSASETTAHAEEGRRVGETPARDAHILVVDDDERIRGLLKKFLVSKGHRVTEARDAAHARRLFAMLAFDLLVVDVMMPGEDGLSFTRWVDGRTPVMLLTARGGIEERIAGLEAGADDYLPKPFEPRELALRIEAILRRANAAPATTRSRPIPLGGARFDAERGELWRGEEEVRLTTAEVAMMRLLAQRVNQPVSRAELLAEMWSDGAAAGEADAAQERAVDVQITRLRRKVEETPKTPRFIKTVRGAGYMLSPDPE
ncbi:MAG: response regulator transcription factor, partial [Pseudomonadota bacterium]